MNGSDKVAVGTGSDAIITDELPDIVIQGLARRVSPPADPWGHAVTRANTTERTMG